LSSLQKLIVFLSILRVELLVKLEKEVDTPNLVGYYVVSRRVTPGTVLKKESVMNPVPKRDNKRQGRVSHAPKEAR